MTRIKDLETVSMGDDVANPPTSALGDWYLSIRDKDIMELKDEDLSRACRQGLFPAALVPLVLRRLEEDPLAGDMYDGEMLASLTGVPSDYWGDNPAARRALRHLLELTRSELNDDMAADIARLEKLTAESIGGSGSHG